MPYTQPVSGQPVAPFIQQTQMWAELLEVLEWWRLQKPVGVRLDPPKIPTVWGQNKTAEDIEVGEMVRFIGDDPIETPPDGDIDQNPAYELGRPEWNVDGLKRIYPSNLLLLPDDHGKILNPPRTMICEFEGTIDPTHNWCMPDVTNPKKLKSAASGVFRLRAKISDTQGLVDITESQNLWRYGDGGDTLFDVEGNTFGDLTGTFVIQDPASEGLCYFANGIFYPLGGGGDVFEFQITTEPTQVPTGDNLQCTANLFDPTDGTAPKGTDTLYMMNELFDDLGLGAIGLCVRDASGDLIAVNAPCTINPDDGPVYPDPTEPPPPSDP